MWLRDVRTHVRMAILAAGLLLLLAGCSSGTAGSTSPGTAATMTASSKAIATISAGPTATPTTSTISGDSAQQGVAEFCSQPPDVLAQLPASIPAYPNAPLHMGQASGSDGLFGICTTDSVSAAASFYATQLPSKGWQQVTSDTIRATQQIMAAKGSAQVIITISPDALLNSETAIIIQTSGA